MHERAINNLELTREKLALACEFFNRQNMPETIHYVWVVFENCINIIKDIKNNTPLYEHKMKEDLFKIYHELGFLNKDYSGSFARLLKLRIRADFGEYANAPRLPDINTVKIYLDEAASLFNEAEALVKKAEKARK